MEEHRYYKDNKIICFVYTDLGEYGKPFLYITDNSSKSDLFKTVSELFEEKVYEIGLRSLWCERLPTARLYRLPDYSWWNDKEDKWCEKDQWMVILNNIFNEIDSEI